MNEITAVGTHTHEAVPTWVAGWIRDYSIYFDTCAVLQTGFPKLVDILRDELLQKNKSLLIPQCTVKELKKLSAGDSEVALSARKALGLVYNYKEEGLVTVVPCADDLRPDEWFQATAFRRGSRKLMFVTHDKKLATDLYRINASESCHGASMKVMIVTALGHLKKYDINHRDMIVSEIPENNAAEILESLGLM